MWNKFKSNSIVFLFCLGLTACQGHRSDISGANDIAAGLNTDEGLIFLSHRVNNIPCQASIRVNGYSDAGYSIDQNLFDYSRLRLTADKFLLAKLPAGNYFIKSIECAQSYRVGGLASLAKFRVEAGRVSNLHVLDIKRVDNSNRITRNVRPFTKNELASIKRAHPELVAKMIDAPMSTAPTEEDIDNIKQLVDKILENKKKGEENKTPAPS